MDRITPDALNKVCLFLDARSLAHLSAVDKSRHSFLQEAASWGTSALKPHQLITSKAKITACFKTFLENLTVDHPSRFFIVSPNGDILLKIDVFCSKGNPILQV